MGALSPDRQAAAMSQTTIAADVHQPFDVHLDPLAQIALNLTLRFKHGSNPAQLVFGEIGNARIKIRTPRSEFWWNANGQCHKCMSGLLRLACWVEDRLPLHVPFSKSLSLSLFMFRVNADHSHNALAVYDLALVAHLFY